VTEFASSMGGEVTAGVAPTGGARFEVAYPRFDPAAAGAAEPTFDPHHSDQHVSEPQPARRSR
jgi:hypothetical protein